MKKGLSRFLLGLTALFTLVPFAAGARGALSQSPSSIERGFAGTPGELVAFAMPQLLEKMGMNVRRASPALEFSLRARFKDDSGWAWEYTVLRESGDFALSLTFPSDIQRMRQGDLIVGVVEKGELTRAMYFHLRMDSGKNVFHVRAVEPDGKEVLALDIAVRAGLLDITRAQLLSLAGLLGPQTISDGLFDGLIDFLEQILSILYDLHDLLNVAICACSETIEMLDDLNGCGWGNTEPGGGAVINLLVCSVEATIEYIDELFSGCLGL